MGERHDGRNRCFDERDGALVAQSILRADGAGDTGACGDQFPVTYYKPLLVSVGAYPAEGVLHLPPRVNLHALFALSWSLLYA